MGILGKSTEKRKMPDTERSAYGLGYEYKRRGEPISHNPFKTESQPHNWFRNGWLARRDIELAKPTEECDGR